MEKKKSKIKARQDKLFAETPDNITKLCSGPCGEIKPLSDFYKGSGKYGRRSQCIICYSEKVKDYHEENREKVLEQGRIYYQNHKEEKRQYAEENKEKIEEYQAKYMEEHKEEICEQRRKYREKNKEIIKIKKKEYYEENKEQILAQKKEYLFNNPHIEVNKYAKRAAAIGDAVITKEEWLLVMGSNGWRCIYCDTSLTKSNRSIDHVVPLSLGGPHHVSNLVPSCISCNSSKGDRKLDDWDAFHKLSESKQILLKGIGKKYDRDQ